MAFGYRATLAQSDTNCDYTNCNMFIKRRTMVWRNLTSNKNIICHRCYTLIGQMQRRKD